jgi:hypothetical protein
LEDLERRHESGRKQEEDNTNNLEITLTTEERMRKRRTISRILEITIPTSRYSTQRQTTKGESINGKWRERGGPNRHLGDYNTVVELLSLMS